jgi:hypothetical protein
MMLRRRSAAILPWEAASVVSVASSAMGEAPS